MLAGRAGLEAQNVVRDYVLDPPTSYTPADPWVRGHVFRSQTGHAGFFYNCDHEEDKRFSPYIDWGCWRGRTLPYQSPCECIREQLNEVRCRIERGAGCCRHPHERVPPRLATESAPSPLAPWAIGAGQTPGALLALPTEGLESRESLLIATPDDVPIIAADQQAAAGGPPATRAPDARQIVIGGDELLAFPAPRPTPGDETAAQVADTRDQTQTPPRR